MLLEEIVRAPHLRTGARQAPLGPYLDDLLAPIESVGYKPHSVHSLVYGIIQFGTYLHQQGLTDLDQLRFHHVQSFVATQPLYRCHGQYQYPISRGVWGARHLWRYACAMGITFPEPAPPEPIYATVLEEWLQYLERHQGLAPGTLALYRRHIRRFFEYLGPDASPTGLQRLEINRVRAYLRQACQGWSPAHRQVVLSTTRIFLRFAWNQGYLSQDLSLMVGRVPSFKHDRLPRGPRWEEAQRLLEAPDRTTELGRRDYAILQLLLTYGVRSQQIRLLSLEDIAWQSSTLHFAPLKGGRPITVPLLPAVGEAILAYLQEGRPSSPSRRLFLSSRPPFSPLTKGGLTSLVARAFAQSGVPSPHHGPHALRHTWATRMLAEGQSLKTMADLLGHRRWETTRLYTKVDIGQLRTVALPWPEEVAS